MGGKTSTTTQPTFQTQTSTPSPQAMQAYQTALDRAEASANIPFQTYSMDPNAFVAPLNSTQTNAIQNITNQQGATNNAFNAAYGQTAQGSIPTYNTVGNYMSPYLNAVAAPTLQYLQQQQGQDLAKQQADAIMHGAYGGDRAGIQRSVLQGQQGLAQAQTLGNILNQGYNTALGAAQQGANQALAAGNQFGNLGVAQQNANLAQGQAQLGAGTAAQQTEQAGKSALYNQFLQYVAYPFQTTQFLANVAGGLGPLTGSTSTGFGMQQTTQPAPFFSDRRLKHNAKKVGDLHDGQPVYKYDYGDGRTQLGLMAQDVEKDHPEAVGLHPSGFKMVDYDSATRDAERPVKAGGGGLSGDIASILAAQAQFLPGQKGQGAGAGYVPQSSGLRPGSMSAPQLNLAPAKAQQQQSGLGQAAGAMKELSGLGSGIKGAYQGAKDLYAKATDAGAGAPASTDLDATDFSKAPMPPERPSDLPDFSAAGDFATGGLVPRHGFAMGGLPGDDNSAGPSYFPDQVLDEGAKSDMATALKAPQLNLTPSGGGGKSGGSEAQGLGSLMGGAGSAMSGIAAILPFLLARGGRVGKAGGGGLLPDVDPDAPAPDADTVSMNTPDPLDYMARTLVREAGNQGDAGQAAVAHVIRNRLNSGRWGDDVASVVTAPKQFTPWNEDQRGTKADPRTIDPSSPEYKKAYGIAKGVMAGDVEDPTKGALNFYNPDLASPTWGEGMANPIRIGAHVFGTASDGGANGLAPRTRLAYAPDTRTASDALPPGAGFASGSPASSDEGGLGSALSSAGGWFDKNQNWLVPLLTGIGTMASSPSRYLGSAILQGLGGGAQAYARQQLQQSQIAKNTLGLAMARFEPTLDPNKFYDKATGLMVTGAQRAAMAGLPYSGGSQGSQPVPSPASTGSLPPSSGSAPSGGLAPSVAPQVAQKPAGLVPTPPPAQGGDQPPTVPAAPSTASDAFAAAAKDPQVVDLNRQADEFSRQANAKLQEANRLAAQTWVPKAEGASARAIAEAQRLNDQAKMYRDQAFQRQNAIAGVPIKAIEAEQGEQIKQRYLPGVTPSGEKYVLPGGTPAGGNITASGAPAVASGNAPPAGVERPAEKSAIDARTGQVHTVLPPAPPGGGYPQANLPPGAKVTERGDDAKELAKTDAEMHKTMIASQPVTDTAIERYRALAQAYKTFKSGAGTEQQHAAAAVAASLNMPDMARAIMRGDVAGPEWVEKQGVNLVLDTLKAATPRFAQSEFNKLSDKGTPNITNQPQANHQLVAEGLGIAMRNKALQEDWEQARQNGWHSLSSFYTNWSKANPMENFTRAAQRQIGNFAGMDLPPRKDWVEGGIYHAPAKMSPDLKSALGKYGVQPGQMFRYTGQGLSPIKPEEAFSAHLGQ